MFQKTSLTIEIKKISAATDQKATLKEEKYTLKKSLFLKKVMGDYKVERKPIGKLSKLK